MKGVVSVFHPFTPSAVGIPEDRIPIYHSRPHVLAMEKLAKDGYQCQVEYLTDRFFPYSVKGNSIEWKFWPVSKRWHPDHKKWKKQWSYPGSLSHCLNTPDVTIINMSGHSSPFSMHLAKLILQKKKKYVAMLGGLHITLDPKRIKYYQNAAHLLVHTNSQKNELEKIDVLKGADIRVFPLGVDCDNYPSPENAPDGKNSYAPQLLFVGRITQLKRIHLAIEALDKLKRAGFPKAKLKIIGPFSSQSYFEHLKNMISDKSLNDSVSFLGLVENNRLIPHYQEADMLLLPSEHESFGMVMIESMACGTPVAAIKHSGGPAEIVKDGHNGILTSVEDYANSIADAFGDRDRISSMKKGARVTAVSAYSVEATYAVLKKSVESCLN